MKPIQTMLFVLAFAALTGIAVTPAVAQEDNGWYLGASAGDSRSNIDQEHIRNGLLGAGLTTLAYEDDEDHFGFKAFGGYQFNRYLALEGGYFDLGNFNFQTLTLPAGTLTGEIKLKGINLDLAGLIPFTVKFAAFARIGATYVDTKDSFTGTGAVIVPDPDPRARNGHYKFGTGLQYAVTDTLALRTEAERYRVDDAVGNDGDIDLFSAGFVYRFGRSAPAAMAAPMPVPATARVESPPLVVVVPVAAPAEQYCSILDFQFEVNQDDIQREEKEKLSVIGTFLNKYPQSSAVIEGHTDNVGTHEANMQLSKRRAEAVVSYLVNTLHVAPSRLSAAGYGDTRPLGDNATEEGKRMNRRIGAVVACVSDMEGLKVKPARLTMALAIEFDGYKSAIKPEYRDELRQLADFLKANPSVTATVEGHTGNLQATADKAMEMSRERAQNVVNYLVDEFGIARSRLSAQGFGQTRRVAYNTTPEGEQENRRVNVIINYPR